MAVQCAHCGEELLGSVNRCWKCGRTLVAHAGPTDVPPVRRAPVKLDAPLAAILMDENAAAEPVAPMRRGSPFAVAVASGEPELRVRLQDAVQVPPTRANLAVKMAGWFSIALGLLAFLVSFGFAAGGLGIALAGIGFALWSLFSQRRVLGTIGLILSFLAMVAAIYMLTMA